MKFTLHLPPGHIDLLNLCANIRAKGCPHCHCQDSVKSHGYLEGQPYIGNRLTHRGLRLWGVTLCENRRM